MVVVFRTVSLHVMVEWLGLAVRMLSTLAVGATLVSLLYGIWWVSKTSILKASESSQKNANCLRFQRIKRSRCSLSGCKGLQDFGATTYSKWIAQMQGFWSENGCEMWNALMHSPLKVLVWTIAMLLLVFQQRVGRAFEPWWYMTNHHP